MHLWVGVLSALYLVVVSVTGAALMFRIQIGAEAVQLLKMLYQRQQVQRELLEKCYRN